MPPNPTCTRPAASVHNRAMAKKRVYRPEGSRPVTSTAKMPGRTRPAAKPEPPKGARGRFEAFSYPLIERMQNLPGFLVPVTLGILLFAGLTLPFPAAGILLILIALFLMWLTAVSWPTLETANRYGRVGINLAVIALGVMKMLDRL